MPLKIVTRHLRNYHHLFKIWYLFSTNKGTNGMEDVSRNSFLFFEKIINRVVLLFEFNKQDNQHVKECFMKLDDCRFIPKIKPRWFWKEIQLENETYCVKNNFLKGVFILVEKLLCLNWLCEYFRIFYWLQIGSHIKNV